jgi:DNA polymerase-3 subunit chi
MHDNADTSDFAGSSGGSSSSPVSSVDSSRSPNTDAGASLRVDFYVLEESSAAARLKLACRLAEKAYLGSQTALIWHTDADELRAFDDLLWTFMDGSFVPHDVLTPNASGNEAPVLLSAGTSPQTKFDVIINLAPDVPACLSQTRRVAEIIDGDDARRRAGRARFKAYRDLGVQPASHNIRTDQLIG